MRHKNYETNINKNDKNAFPKRKIPGRKIINHINTTSIRNKSDCLINSLSTT